MLSRKSLPGCRRVLAVDPGNPDLGAALFVDGALVAARWVKVKRPADERCPACRLSGPCRHAVEPQLLTALCDEMERELGIHALAGGDPRMPEALVCELPLYFGPELGGGSPIGKLITVVGALCDRAAAWGARAYTYRPSEWKGTAKKAAHQAQALCGFEEAELALLPRVGRRGARWKYASDPADAACLGAWWLQRVGARRVLRHHNFAAMRDRVQG
jgi:hypothetical protein